MTSLLLAYPALAANPSTTQSSQNHSNSGASPNVPFVKNGDEGLQLPGLTQGETITLTSSQGVCRLIEVPSKTCTASGSVTFTVTGVFHYGYSLSLTSGTLNINGTSYTISGGSAEEGEYLANIVGQGTTGDGSAFLFHGRSLGDFGVSNQAILNIDFKGASGEFGIRLLVTTSHS